MTVKRLEDGRYTVDVRPRGRAGKRIRKIFDRKGDAYKYEKSVIAKFQNNDCIGRTPDKRYLSEFIALWWQLIGRNKPWAEKRLSAAICICNDMCDPMIFQINSRRIIDYRSYRLDRGVKASTINHDIFTLSAIFNEMGEIDEFHGENPINVIKALKVPKTEMSYLTKEEITALLDIARGDYYRIAVLLLSTGARWGECYNLKAENIIDNKVMFTLTKNGKRRIVPVSGEVINTVKHKISGRLFRVSYSAFRLLMKKAKPDLPCGQAAHALRHTFATHFMMNGGNIITLQRILGHADISQTMIYAHFSPDYLQEAINHNPLAGVSLSGRVN